MDIRDPYHTGAYSAPYMRRRRASSMSRSMSRSHSRMSLRHDYHAMGGRGTVIKFKRKGGFRSGITLGEAMSDAHLSNNDYYSLYDLNADARGRIILKLRVSRLRDSSSCCAPFPCSGSFVFADVRRPFRSGRASTR